MACWWTDRASILGTIGPAPTPGAAPGRGQGAPRPSGHLFAFDLKTKQRTQLTNENVGGIDGIEPDGSGGLLVTDVIGQRLLHVAKSGQVRVLAQFSAGGADFGYIGAKRIAVVPFLFENRVAAYDLTNAPARPPPPLPPSRMQKPLFAALEVAAPRACGSR